jgi:hypothetical protein
VLNADSDLRNKQTALDETPDAEQKVQARLDAGLTKSGRAARIGGDLSWIKMCLPSVFAGKRELAGRDKIPVFPNHDYHDQFGFR